MARVHFFKWCAKCGGMDTPMVSKLKDVEVESTKLKKKYAEE
jgi:putative transposase